MKKRILTVLLSLAILVTFMPSMAFAAEAAEPEARIGTTPYETLEAALDAASSGDTVTLLKDVSTDTIKSEQGFFGQYVLDGVTIDLAGHTWATEQNGRLLEVISSGSVTIKNGTTIGRIRAGNSGNNQYGVISLVNVTLRYSEYIGGSATSIVYADYDGSSVYLDKCTVEYTPAYNSSYAIYATNDAYVSLENTSVKTMESEYASRLIYAEDGGHVVIGKEGGLNNNIIQTNSNGWIAHAGYNGWIDVYSGNFSGSNELFAGEDDWDDTSVLDVYGGAYDGNGLANANYWAHGITSVLYLVKGVAELDEPVADDTTIIVNPFTTLKINGDFAEAEEDVKSGVTVLQGGALMLNGKFVIGGVDPQYDMFNFFGFFTRADIYEVVEDVHSKPIVCIDFYNNAAIDNDVKYSKFGKNVVGIKFNMLNNSTLFVPAGTSYNLQDNSAIKGNVVVDGDLTVFKAKNVNGTVYVSGNLVIADNAGSTSMKVKLVKKGAKVYSDYNLVDVKQLESLANYEQLTSAADRKFGGKEYKYVWQSLVTTEDVTPDPAGAKDITKATFSAPAAKQTYTGVAVTPAVKITDSGYTLVEGTDYRVEYSNNVAVGDATMLVTGMGKYKGTKEFKFQITTNDTVVDSVVSEFEALKTTTDAAAVSKARADYDALTEAQKLLVKNYSKLEKAETRVHIAEIKSLKVESLKLTAGKKKVTVKWSAVEHEDLDGYRVYRATSKNGTYKLVKSTTKLSFVNKSLKKGKKYYYKVRGYEMINGTRYFTKYSPVKYKRTK